MRFTVIVPPKFVLPKNPALASAVAKGARAYRAGYSMESNPYNESSGGFGAAFQHQWNRGWQGMEAGILKIEEHNTRNRRLAPIVETR